MLGKVKLSEQPVSSNGLGANQKTSLQSSKLLTLNDCLNESHGQETPGSTYSKWPEVGVWGDESKTGKSIEKNVADDSESGDSLSDADPIDWLNGSNIDLDLSDSNSEGGSSDSSSYSFLLEEDPPLAEIPLTTDEEKLINEFYGKMDKVAEDNSGESRKPYTNFNFTKSALERVRDLLKEYLPQGIRLNSSYNNKPTLSDLVLEEILNILNRATVITSAVRRNLLCTDSPGTSELDDQNNQNTIVDIVRKLIINGGRVKLYDANDPEDRYERLSTIVSCYELEFVSKYKQICNKLKDTAYEGITNKDQVQKDNLVVDIDNCYFYTKYPQDSTIEVAKVVSNSKVKELGLRCHIFHIGESIVRVKKDKDGKRDYTDVLQGSIEMSFVTHAGEIIICLHPNSTEIKDGKKENKRIKVEIDEKSKTRFSQLGDEEKKSLGKNCLLGGQSVSEVMVKSLKKNGDVPARFTKTLADPLTSMKQIFLGQPPEADARSI